MNKPTREELEAQVKQLAAQLELSLAAERAWETTMMQVCGEDGVGSVADKFKRLTIDAECYKRGMEASNERLVQLAAETSGFHAVQVEMSGVTDEDYEQCPKRVQDVIRHLCLVQIPAYNDFLSSLRAEGVEMLLTENFKVEIAGALADFDGVDDATLQTVIWSGQPPEPDGDVWHIEYMTRGCEVQKKIREFAAQLRSKSAISSADDAIDIEPFGFVRRSGDLVVIDVNGDPHIKDGMPVFVRSKSEVQS